MSNLRIKKGREEMGEEGKGELSPNVFSQVGAYESGCRN
jgi:hypothetical protein